MPVEFVGVAGADRAALSVVNDIGDLLRIPIDWATGPVAGLARRRRLYGVGA
ncbi:hypothetical protein [Gemmatimonas sp.]|uniref:hypothetical protein n=1 Tax=Gemmatimonas sp. TaxID=1962908 RepID=UPI003F70020B